MGTIVVGGRGREGGSSVSPEESKEVLVRPRTGEEAAAAFGSVSCVAFDVDSTVSTEEGIDELAAALGAGEAVAAWTKKAMGGDVTFQEAIAARLALIKPTKGAVEEHLAASPAELTEGMEELIAALHAAGKKVVFVSGGLLPLIRPLAEKLAVGEIYAIDLYFDDAGDFLDFDRRAPTAATGGKAIVLESLRERYGSVAMVGDGVTDVEAAPYADVMVGFGANVVRQPVKDNCDWWVESTAPLLQAVVDHQPL